MKPKTIMFLFSIILIGSFLCTSCKKEGDTNENPPIPQVTVPILATIDASDITASSAKVGGNVTDNGGENVTERGVCYSTSSNPNINDNLKIQSGSGTGFFECNIEALDHTTMYYYKAYAINSVGVGYGVQKSFTTLNEVPTFTDPRDGQVYKIVTIGTQTWFAENLNFLKSGSSYYGNDSVNCSIYGRLYSHSSAKTACPDGWRLPSDDDFDILRDYLGGNSVAGGKMKETGTEYWNHPNAGATNESGFSALPGGHRNDIYPSYNYSDKGNTAYFWTSKAQGTEAHWLLKIYHSNASAGLSGGFNGERNSVRCIKNQ